MTKPVQGENKTMKKILQLSLLLALAAFWIPTGANAQGPTPIQQTGTRPDAASFFVPSAPATNCATVNTTAALGTITVPAVNGHGKPPPR